MLAEFERLLDRLTAADPMGGPQETVRILMLTRQVRMEELACVIGRLLDEGSVYHAPVAAEHQRVRDDHGPAVGDGQSTPTWPDTT